MDAINLGKSSRGNFALYMAATTLCFCNHLHGLCGDWAVISNL